jgi:hypothetical protein
MVQDTQAILRSEAWTHPILETNKLFSSTILRNRDVESHYPPKFSCPSSIFKPSTFEKFIVKSQINLSIEEKPLYKVIFEKLFPLAFFGVIDSVGMETNNVITVLYVFVQNGQSHRPPLSGKRLRESGAILAHRHLRPPPFNQRVSDALPVSPGAITVITSSEFKKQRH